MNRLSQIGGALREAVSIDLRSLALFRIAVSLVVLDDLVSRAVDTTAHYTDAGVLPRIDLIRLDPGVPSLHLALGSTWFAGMMFAVQGLFAVMLLLGYRTRLATVVSWVLMLSLHHRNPYVLQAGDVLLRLLLFWSMFLPLGARWSLDAKAGTDLCPDASLNNRFLSIASVALLVQVCLVYMVGAVLKWHPVWREGHAVWYAMHLDLFATSWGVWLREQSWGASVMRGLTWWTLGLEFFGPLLAFVPWRNGFFRGLTVALFLSLHLGLLVFMMLGQFPYISMAGWLVFVPGAMWDRWRWTAAKPASEPVVAAGRGRTLGAFVSGAAFVYVLLWNLHVLKPHWVDPWAPEDWQRPGRLVGLNQKWNMFAPYPSRGDGWFVIPGSLADGSVVDLFTGGGPVSWDKPALVTATLANQNWRKYLFSLTLRGRDAHRQLYARYLAQQWNRWNSGDRRVVSLEVCFMKEFTRPTGPAPPIKTVLATWRAKATPQAP